MSSALDRACEKYGCAKVFLDPKLHTFDDCFGGAIRMGDLDGAVERNRHILWMEWKRGVILDAFETQFKAQIRQARAFTENSPRQTFIFVVGCPVEMDVNAYRVMWRGRFGPWEHGGTDALKARLTRWFAYADKQRGAACPTTSPRCSPTPLSASPFHGPRHGRCSASRRCRAWA